MESNEKHILELVRTRGLIRARDLADRELPRVALTRMVQRGVLVRVGRGLYALPSRSTSEQGFIAEAAAKTPGAVVCLLSALRIHSLTTQSPFEVWIAIPSKARAPRSAGIAVRVMRFSETSMDAGLETKQIDGIDVRVTNVGKTVADCFKYRNKIGLDVALEALRQAWQAKRVTMDDLWHFAGICRMTNVMRPYLESLT
jgi:predicted transcriptional regulator of viral defense system